MLNTDFGCMLLKAVKNAKSLYNFLRLCILPCFLNFDFGSIYFISHKLLVTVAAKPDLVYFTDF